MTLQYRLRSLSEDREWQRRVSLSSDLLLQAVDWWCRSGSEFPVPGIVAAVLHLFSPRCKPEAVRESGMRETLLALVGTPGAEYRQTWPQRPDWQQCRLIDHLTQIVANAVTAWTAGGLDDPTVESVNRQIVDQIVAQQYVVFHHKETTRRDFGGFHCQG